MKMSKAVVIRKVLGMPSETMINFRDQYQQLTEADKLELAQGAAGVLGLTADQVDFPLA
jgi:hypothetical protein